MTKSEYSVAIYCLGDTNSIVFDTLDSVAQKIGTSTTSVIRFCRRLGYRGFKEFQDDIRQSFRNLPNLPEKFRRTASIAAPNELIEKTVRQNIECIQKTMENLSHKDMSEAVSLLAGANKVFCFGMKESFALAHYAYTRLLAVRKDVYLLDISGGELESVLSISKNDAVYAFLFHRYTSSALKLLEILKKRGVNVILVTSPPVDKVSELATVLLPCYVDAGGVKNSSVAPVCLCDYFCDAVAIAGGDSSLEHLKATELLLAEAAVIEE